jgi:hypothetical protein
MISPRLRTLKLLVVEESIMTYESDMLQRAREERRRQRIATYGEAVVAEMERLASRHRLELTNYRNVAHLLARDEREGAQPVPEPKLPTYEELAARMRVK